MNRPSARILIGTPAHSNHVTCAYLDSIVQLQRFLANSAIEINVFTNSIARIEMARNLIASIVYSNKDISHLLIIDADMGFTPQLITDMVEFDKPIVSTIYPQRGLDLLAVSKTIGESNSKLSSIANEYVFPEAIETMNGHVDVKHGRFVKVKYAGTGIMLIQRQVLERMAQLPGMLIEPYKPRLPVYPNLLLNCFKQIEDERGILSGEDTSFCHRWTQQLGGEIWACISHEITHAGMFNFTGRFLDKLSS